MTETIKVMTVEPTHPDTARAWTFMDNLASITSAWGAARELQDDEDLADDLMREASATARYDVLITEGQNPGKYKVILWVDGYDEDLALERAAAQAEELEWEIATGR